MLPEKQIEEFVKRMTEAAGKNLESVVLYGSASDGEYHPDYSNVNLLCVMRDTSFATLSALAEPVGWWHKQKHRQPLILTRQELERSADVFSIEMLDMQQRHRILFGNDPLKELKIPTHLHRAQLEYELREKLILLRERCLLAVGDRKRLWDLILQSVSTFVTLFRHALIELGETVPSTKRETVQAIAARVQFDPEGLLRVLDIREHKAETSQFDVNQVFSKYLLAVEQVTAAVDRMLDSVPKTT